MGPVMFVLCCCALTTSSGWAQGLDIRSYVQVTQRGREGGPAQPITVPGHGVVTLERREFHVTVWLDVWREYQCLDSDGVEYCPTVIIKWYRDRDCWVGAAHLKPGTGRCAATTGTQVHRDSIFFLGKFGRENVGFSQYDLGGTEMSFGFDDPELLSQASPCMQVHVELFPHPAAEFPLCFLPPPATSGGGP